MEVDDLEAGAEKKPFLEHVSELRQLLLRCAGTLLLASIVVGTLFPFFADLLHYPLAQAVGNDAGVMQGLVTTSPMGVFSVLLQVCFFGGLAISLPIMLVFIVQFVKPGLSAREQSIVLPGCLALFMLFIVGALFSYFLVIPASLAIAIKLNQLFGFQLIWSAPHYYGLVVWMTLGIGLCFEFPLVLLLLVATHIVSTQRLRSLRRHMVIAILITAAFITPGGDPFTLMLLAIPMYLLYEAALILCKRIERSQHSEKPATDKE